VMADGMIELGVNVKTTDDGMIVEGGEIGSGTVHSHDDHRIAMAFAMAGLCANGDIHIEDCDNVNTSFPGFAELAASCGLSIQVINE